MNFTPNQKIFINSLLAQLNFNQIVKFDTDKFKTQYFYSITIGLQKI